MTKNIQLSDREFDLILDAVINRREDMEDILPFSISPLPVKIRIRELTNIQQKLRSYKNVTKIQ